MPAGAFLITISAELTAKTKASKNKSVLKSDFIDSDFKQDASNNAQILFDKLKIN